MCTSKLFLPLILLCVAGCYSVPAERQIHRRGGQIAWTYENLVFPRAEVFLEARDCHVDDATLAQLTDSLRALRTKNLVLEDQPITDASIPSLKRVGTLEQLVLPGTKVTPGGVKSLKGMPELQRIRVGDSFSEEAVEELKAALPEVRFVRMVRLEGYWYDEVLAKIRQSQEQQSSTRSAPDGGAE